MLDSMVGVRKLHVIDQHRGPTTVTLQSCWGCALLVHDDEDHWCAHTSFESATPIEDPKSTPRWCPYLTPKLTGDHVRDAYDWMQRLFRARLPVRSIGPGELGGHEVVLRRETRLAVLHFYEDNSSHALLFNDYEKSAEEVSILQLDGDLIRLLGDYLA